MKRTGSGAPEHTTKEERMFTHLLVPVDGTELSERAEQTGIDLAKKLGARITGFVAEPMPPMPTMAANVTAYQRDSDAHMARTEEHANEVLKRFAARAAEPACPSRASSSAPTASTMPSSRPAPNSAATSS
jgi:nucleotide-binding universal stress UspA family protein